MSITDIELLAEGRAGSIDENYERNYTSMFLVTTSNKFDDAAYIVANISYGGVAYHIGTPYPGDIYAYCRSIEATFQEVVFQTAALWKVKVDFGVISPFFALRDPTLAPIIPTIEGQNYESIVVTDKDGNYLQNTAGEQYDPPAKVERTRATIKFTQNFATLPPVFALVNCINNDTWQGFAPFVCKFNLPRAQELTSQYLQSTYWKVDFEIEVDPLTWILQLLNAGVRQLVSGKLVPCTGDDLSQSTVASCLDSAGKQLTNPVSPTAIIYNPYHIYQEISFSSTFGSAPFGWPTNLFNVYAL